MRTAWTRLTSRHCLAGETPGQVIQRVLATLETSDEIYKQMLAQGRFLFAGRTFKTADPQRGIYPNCTVLDAKTSIIEQVM